MIEVEIDEKKFIEKIQNNDKTAIRQLKMLIKDNIELTKRDPQLIKYELNQLKKAVEKIDSGEEKRLLSNTITQMEKEINVAQKLIGSVQRHIEKIVQLLEQQ